MFWSRSRRPAPSSVRLRLDPLLEDRCVPCSGHEVMAAAVAPAAVVAPPATPAPAQVVASPASPAASVAPPAAATGTTASPPTVAAESLVAGDMPVMSDPTTTPC